MSVITENQDLADFCSRLAEENFVAVDTEFLREKTYWPQLCLIQLAGEKEARAVDALAPGLDLSPVYALLQDAGVTKVFHAARQDIEIFLYGSGAVPRPLFDTQVAAMVCGFGDQVGYETLVRKLAGASIDKTSRFTDWTLRPLSDKQIDYALSDVTHLRTIYRKLKTRLDRTGRLDWLASEMEVLADPATYRTEPDEAWRRLKIRSTKPRFVAVLKELAAWRERTAQDRDLPRNRVVRDEALLEIAAHAPKSVSDLARTRGLPKGVAEGRFGGEMLEAVRRGLDLPADACPSVDERPVLPKGLGPVVDLLKVLLKMKCDDYDVAQKLVASSADLEAIAADDEADVPALKGWRRELFGEDALALKQGRIALVVEARQVRAVPVSPPPVARSA